jgi:hypothetical protein
MKRFILILVTILLCAYETSAQKLSVSNSDIFIQVGKDSVYKDSVFIEIKNLSEKKDIAFSMIDGVNIAKYSPNYVGIGLYSSLFPYAPDYIAKYSKELNMRIIRPKGKLLLKEKYVIDLAKGYNFSFDYIIINDTSSHYKVTREVYDKGVVFLKFNVKN